MQARHELDPASEYVPGAQKVHTDDIDAPVSAENVPAGQDKHTTVPVNAEYVLNAHALHDELPDVDEYIPAAHIAQDATVEYCPAVQVTEDDVHDIAPAADVKPEAQAMHTDEPAALE